MATKAPEMCCYVRDKLRLAERSPNHVESSARIDALMDVLCAIGRGCCKTAVALRTTVVEKVQTTNEFGDDVLTADLVADKQICDELRECAHVASFASEEHPELTVVRTRNTDSLFTVTFDPLDGSSIIDTNFSVGSIFAIWAGATCIGQLVREIALSIVTVYGPRTTLFVGHKSFGVLEFMLMNDTTSEWRLVRTKPFDVAPKAKFFSPGNLRASNDLPKYREFLKQAVRDKLTLRYTGGMVPDVTQILVKGSGVFATPAAARFKVKLRVCFECGPLAHMMECAGGLALDENGEDYSLKVVEKMDQRSGVVLGSRDTVASLKAALTTGTDVKSKL